MAVESLWRDTSHSIDGYRPDDGMMNLPPDGWRVRLRTEDSFGTGPAGRSIMLTRDKDLRRRGDELFDGQKNRQSDKQAEPTEPK